MGVLLMVLVGKYGADTYSRLRTGPVEPDVHAVEMQPVTRPIYSGDLDTSLLMEIRNQS